MKFQTVFSFLFVGTSFADAASFGKNFGEPKCVLFDTIKMRGGAEFVDTEGSGFPLITTGNMMKLCLSRNLISHYTMKWTMLT